MPRDQTAHSTTGQTWNDVLPMSLWLAGAGSGGAGGVGAAKLGSGIDFTAAMKQREEVPHGEDLRLIESAGGDERWYERLDDPFRVRVETLSPDI